VQWKDLLRAAAIVLLVLLPDAARAHDIPASVVVQAFVRPQGETLRVLVRLPLAAMRDVEFPLTPDGLLDIGRGDQVLRDAATLWITRELEVYEENARLDQPRVSAVRVSLPSDRSFVTFETALAHVTGPPLAPDTAVIWSQALFDVLLEYGIRSDRSTFSIRPSLARLGVRVATVLRYQPPAGAERASSTWAIPDSCGSIRDGTRRHGGSSRWASRTFSMARIICSFSSAW
jgi:hypothetical protein